MIDTFMLDRSLYLVDFVGQVARLKRGRAFLADPERPGRCALVDFVRNIGVTSAAAALAMLAVACAPPPPPTATPIPTPLPTRAVRSTPTPPATPTPEPPPTATPAPTRVFTARDFDPYVDLYATERDGLFVTTRNPRGRYYYRWDDRRWYALEDRVWFRSAEDLLTVFPQRVAAP